MDLPKFTPFMLKNQPDQTAYLLNKLSAGSGGGGGKLYNTTGTNTDGAMTQKATTDALGTKANAVDVGNALAGKVDKEPGKGLSTNDFTDADEAKLDGIEAGAQVNVQADWDESDTTSDSYIQNKPAIPAAQVNADWNATSGVAEILNKPTIPTNTSDLVNDSGFLVPGDDVSELVNDANYVRAEEPGTATPVTPSISYADLIWSGIFDKIYPVGSIFMSATLSTPADVATALGGGTWVAWGSGRVPVGVDTGDTDFDATEETGGYKNNDFSGLLHYGMTSYGYTNGATGYSDRIVVGIANGRIGTGESAYAPFSSMNNLQPYITCYMYKRVS